jgi:hypothetical protein
VLLLTLKRLHNCGVPSFLHTCAYLVLLQNAFACMQARNNVFKELRKAQPTIKLLYTTPEQLQASAALGDVMADLQSRCSPRADV